MSARKNFSEEKKKEILQQLRKGLSIKEAATTYAVSQTSIYLWMKQYPQHSPLIHKTPASKLNTKQESLLIKNILKHPHQSLKSMAASKNISAVTLWKILKKYNLQTKIQRKNYLLHKGNKLRHDVSYKERCYLVRSFLQGTSITVLSKRAGVSRTILYQWARRYQHTGTYTSLQTKRPRGTSHWKQGAKALAPLVPAFIYQHPKETLDKLYQSFGEQVQQPISKASFYMLLRRFDLNTISRRTAYATNRHKISKLEEELLHIKETALVVQTQKYMAKGSEMLEKELWDISFVVLLCGIFLISWTYFSFGLLPRLPLAEVGQRSSENVTGRLTEMQTRSETFLAGLFPKENDSQVRDERKIMPEASPSPMQSSSALPSVSPLKDFSTGVIVMNTHKNTYKVGEEVQVGMAVLDPKGQTICTATMTLTVTTPNGTKKVFSTENGGILRSQDCQLTSVTHTPDYSVTFTATEESYRLSLTAETGYGTKVMTDTVQVAPAPFEIQHTDFPTRIYPGSPYWLGFTVVVEEDFVGELRESVPGFFSVRQVSGGGKIVVNPQTKQSELVWPVSLRKGQLYRFSYTMQFPEVSPELYELGPIKFHDAQGATVFEEARKWQIASDAI